VALPQKHGTIGALGALGGHARQCLLGNGMIEHACLSYRCSSLTIAKVAAK
jgi:hypothetical protein